MADEQKKDEQSEGGIVLLDFELALMTYEANGFAVSRRAHALKSKCPKCEHDVLANITEFTAEDAVLRLKSCTLCRHEVREGASKPAAPAAQA